MFNAKQFRELIVSPVLHALGEWTQPAEDLLVMTAAHESFGGTFLKQEGGPAMGVYQMEQGTFNDIWNRTLQDKQSPLMPLRAKIMNLCNMIHEPIAEDMIWNLYFATAMCRVYYLRVYSPIPADIVEMSKYAKKYYNSELGAATSDEYLRDYYKFENIKA